MPTERSVFVFEALSLLASFKGNQQEKWGAWGFETGPTSHPASAPDLQGVLVQSPFPLQGALYLVSAMVGKPGYNPLSMFISPSEL